MERDRRISPRWGDYAQFPRVDPQGGTHDELINSDLILVGSEFVKSTFAEVGVDPAKCRVIPYGFRSSGVPNVDKVDQDFTPDRPLRLLFVGQVNQRKGIGYVIELAEELRGGECEIRVAGSCGPALANILRDAPNVSYVGQVDHTELDLLYSWADLLLLPSVFEGLALVTLEAMARGVPVIVTPNTGAVPPVVHTHSGLVIRPHNSADLITAVRSVLDGQVRLSVLSSGAVNAVQDLTWANYRRGALNALRDLIDSLQ